MVHRISRQRRGNGVLNRYGKGYGFLVCLGKEDKKLVSSFVWERVWFPCLFEKGRKKIGFLVCLEKGMVSLFVWERKKKSWFPRLSGKGYGFLVCLGKVKFPRLFGKGKISSFVWERV